MLLALLLSALAGSGSAAVLVPRAAASPWVTVDVAGSASTVTPTVSDSKTISAAPSQLTQSATYALVLSGTTTSTTGSPAVATAASSSGEGAFLACSNYQGAYKPFCQPQEGSELAPGGTYYVTWDPSFFYAGATVEVEIEYSVADASGVSGFITGSIDAARGYYVWTIDSDFLSTHSTTSASATIVATYTDTTNNGTDSATGPTVVITAASSSSSSSGGHYVSALAVALPVVLGLAVLIVLAFSFWSWRRYGSVLPCCSGRSAGGRNSQPTRTTSFLQQNGIGMGTTAVAMAGPPVVYSKAEPAATAADIPLTDRGSWSPTRGHTNVFRQELRRQEEAAAQRAAR